MVLAGKARQRAQAREQVAATTMVLAAVDEIRIEAERQVVEEQPIVDSRDVDALLDAVEGGERAERVVAVEPEVAGEVVTRAERDADEREITFDRNLCDRRQRAVTAC